MNTYKGGFMNMRQKKIISPDIAPFCSRVKETVRSIAPGARIFLFGSRARGRADKNSDWDFLILLDQKVERDLHDRLKDSLYDLELETDTVLTSIVRAQKDWLSSQYEIMPLKQEIEREGIEI
jgi:predicted nucleotidyltransferase